MGFFTQVTFSGSFRIFLFQDVTMEKEVVTLLGAPHYRRGSGVSSCISKECHTGEEENTLANVFGEVCLN